MKKLLLVFLSLFALQIQAKEVITIVYGWSPGDVAANFHRSLAEEANKLQNKYTFLFDTKPGAGASIATQYVARTPNTILATSSAFWIRPNFFPGEYQVDDFREMMPQCDESPQIVSKKYKSWNNVPLDRPVTIGVSGLGITTHLIATEVSKKYPNMIVVPFKSTTEAMINVISDNTDFSVNFVGDSDQYVNSKEEKTRLYVLGVTGPKPDGNTPTLVSKGFPKILSQMNAPTHLVVPSSMPDSKFNELRSILVKAGNTPSVKKSFAVDHCQQLNQMPDDQIQPWFNKQNATWKSIASGISLK